MKTQRSGIRSFGGNTSGISRFYTVGSLVDTNMSADVEHFVRRRRSTIGRI